MTERLFQDLLPSPIVVVEGDPRTFPADLSPLEAQEAAMMQKAVDKRRREFTAARVYARQAYESLGGTGTIAIVHDEDRAPIWPEGFVGSITHTHTWCAVAMARSSDVQSVGIDVERDGPLEERLWDTVCTPTDLEWLRSLPESRQGDAGKELFSAKECAYKAQYQLTQKFLGFQAMSVVVRGNMWTATFEQAAGRFAIGDVLEGRVERVEGLIATAIAL